MAAAEVAAIHSAGLAGKDLTQAAVSSGAPTLTATLSAGNVVVSYPASASGFTLQSSANLAENTWAPVTNAPVASGGNLTVSLPASGGALFFRLKE